MERSEETSLHPMSYCFMNFLRNGQGLAPDCPDGVGFVLLADLPRVPWGLFAADENDAWSPQHLVSAELAALIESGKRYPPALALARDEVRQVFGDHCPSEAEFARAYGLSVRTHLSRQHESSYVLAPALKDGAGDLTKGEWYWVLRISGKPPAASWVSRDFHVYSNDMNDFDLTGQQLKRLGHSG